MSTTLENALADVIVDMMREERWTNAEMQRRIGISSRSFQNYFKERSRPIPLRVVYSIADVLGVPGHELMRRAEERAAAFDTHEAAAERALAGIDPELAERVRRVDREQRDAQEDDSQSAERMSRSGRSAMTRG